MADASHVQLLGMLYSTTHEREGPKRGADPGCLVGGIEEVVVTGPRAGAPASCETTFLHPRAVAVGGTVHSAHVFVSEVARTGPWFGLRTAACKPASVKTTDFVVWAHCVILTLGYTWAWRRRDGTSPWA